MAATNGTIKKNATAITPTGGSDITYSQVAGSSAGVVVVQDAAVADFTVRPSIEMKSRPPAIGKDGYYSKRKSEMKPVFPKKRADGSTVFSVWRITNESAVELTDAEFDDQLFQAAQLIGDPDYRNFWRNGVTV